MDKSYKKYHLVSVIVRCGRCNRVLGQYMDGVVFNDEGSRPAISITWAEHDPLPENRPTGPLDEWVRRQTIACHPRCGAEDVIRSDQMKSKVWEGQREIVLGED